MRDDLNLQVSRGHMPLFREVEEQGGAKIVETITLETQAIGIVITEVMIVRRTVLTVEEPILSVQYAVATTNAQQSAILVKAWDTSRTAALVGAI